MAETFHFFTDTEQWARAAASQFAADETGLRWQRLLASDIDDSLIDANKGWHAEYLRLAAEKGLDASLLAEVVTFKVSPRRYFTDPQLGLGDEYLFFKERLMHNPEFHAGMTAMAGAAEALSALGSTSVPHAYISTRPPEIGEATYQNLRQLGFNEAPILLRGKDIPYGQTVQYKTRAVIALHMALHDVGLPGVAIEYVDDYQAVTDAINGLNQPYLIGTHFNEQTTWPVIVERLQSLAQD